MGDTNKHRETQTAEAVKLNDLLAEIPSNWCDPLLTGKNAVIGEPPYDCTDIEQILIAIRDRIKHKIDAINFG